MNFLLKDMHYLAGDRLFHEDHALIGGIGYLDQSPVMVLGIEKGHDTETRIAHRFGMARPEGYRKAQRLMRLANQFSLPIVTFVDTAGAYPGVEAEARGQSEAIARSIEICLSVEVPLISVIIGEGGSGGAVALATANRILMLEHSIYSVISPEGCASILWRKEAKQEAAQALKLTAQDLQQLGIIDDIIPETLGGAHRDSEKTMDNVGQALRKHLKSLQGLNRSLRQDREEKFEKMTRELGPQK
jgi:acetyl-CoA carboxylase carboxyl transferase subunit alpha